MYFLYFRQVCSSGLHDPYVDLHWGSLQEWVFIVLRVPGGIQRQLQCVLIRPLARGCSSVNETQVKVRSNLRIRNGIFKLQIWQCFRFLKPTRKPVGGKWCWVPTRSERTGRSGFPGRHLPLQEAVYLRRGDKCGMSRPLKKKNCLRRGEYEGRKGVKRHPGMVRE